MSRASNHPNQYRRHTRVIIKVYGFDSSFAFSGFKPVIVRALGALCNEDSYLLTWVHSSANFVTNDGSRLIEVIASDVSLLESIGDALSDLDAVVVLIEARRITPKQRVQRTNTET